MPTAEKCRQPLGTRQSGASLVFVWVLDPANSPELIARLRRHAPGMEVAWAGEGWRSLVAECHEALERRFPDYQLLNIKQKDGALAFQAFPRPGKGTWTQGEYTELLDITYAYKNRSASICEWCGMPVAYESGDRWRS